MGLTHRGFQASREEGALAVLPWLHPALIIDVYNCTSCLSEELGLLSKMSKWAKLSELDSCFFAKACLSWSKLHSCTDMSRAFSEPRLSNFALLSDSWVIQDYFVWDGSLSRLYFTKKKSLIGSLYRLGGSIRFGYCVIPCFGGLCEERLPCFCPKIYELWMHHRGCMWCQ